MWANVGYSKVPQLLPERHLDLILIMSFGLGNITFGSSLVQTVDLPSGSLLSYLASASADGDVT